MLYLHSSSPPICHSDLKSSNVLWVSIIVCLELSLEFVWLRLWILWLGFYFGCVSCDAGSIVGWEQRSQILGWPWIGSIPKFLSYCFLALEKMQHFFCDFCLNLHFPNEIYRTGNSSREGSSREASPWMAPEVINGNKPTIESDVVSNSPLHLWTNLLNTLAT